MKNPFRKENFIKVVNESDSQPMKLPTPPTTEKIEKKSREELEKIYSNLCKKYEKDHSDDTYKKLMAVHRTLTSHESKEIQSPKQSPVIHDKILDKAREIASSYHKNFDELDSNKQDRLIEKAELELQSDEILQTLMNEPEENEEVKQLKIEYEKLQENNIKTEIIIGDLKRKLVDLDIIIEEKEEEIKYLRTELHEEQPVEQVEETIISNEQSIKNDSQIAYDLIQKHKEKQLDPKQKLAYQLGKLELYCLSCKHTIQAHSKGGESNGCGCGCLRTIEDIAKENKIPLITKNNYKKIHNGSKHESFISKNFIPKKETKIESIEDIPLNPSIIKQANAIKSMMTRKTPATELEGRAQVMQINTQQKLKEESRRKIDLAEVPLESCTCGHMMDVHFESSGFCTEMDCPCDQFRDYPK